jgi:hypothetical protein
MVVHACPWLVLLVSMPSQGLSQMMWLVQMFVLLVLLAQHLFQEAQQVLLAQHAMQENIH